MQIVPADFQAAWQAGHLAKRAVDRVIALSIAINLPRLPAESNLFYG